MQVDLEMNDKSFMDLSKIKSAQEYVFHGDPDNFTQGKDFSAPVSVGARSLLEESGIFLCTSMKTGTLSRLLYLCDVCSALVVRIARVLVWVAFSDNNIG